MNVVTVSTNVIALLIVILSLGSFFIFQCKREKNHATCYVSLSKSHRRSNFRNRKKNGFTSDCHKAMLPKCYISLYLQKGSPCPQLHGYFCVVIFPL